MRKVAVIWRKKGGFKVFITPHGEPPTNEDIELAKEYDKELQKKIGQITRRLRKKSFFRISNKMKRWHMLGKELQFLDDMDLRLRCDPNMENTWRALYDLAPHLAPTEQVPTDKQRVEGSRNHFYICYLLGKMKWDDIKKWKWAHWNDMYMALSSLRKRMWKDDERLFEWVITRACRKGPIRRKELRTVLRALRRAIGRKADMEMDTTVLSKEELYSILDAHLEKAEE